MLAYVLPPPSEPEAPFSAEGYLRASTGPLAKSFRAMIPDVDSLERLDINSLSAIWRKDLDRYATHYSLDPAQRAEAEKALEQKIAEATTEFRSADLFNKIQQYKEDITHVDRVLSNPASLKFERERAYKQRRELESTRRGLMATVNGWTGALHETWTPKAKATASGEPPPALRTKLDWINMLTMFGMIAVGVCLMLGFLTPLAALGGAAFLTMFYLSMPPWPGVPVPPNSEGHYLFVNKNLIELLACLVLASTPSGLWIGLDAIFFGRMGRRAAPPSNTDGSAVEPTGYTVRIPGAQR